MGPIFVAFSEYMNFTYITKPFSTERIFKLMKRRNKWLNSDKKLAYFKIAGMRLQKGNDSIILFIGVLPTPPYTANVYRQKID